MSSGEAEQALKYKTWVLKVLIHCHGCARKVRKVLQAIDGVFRTAVDAQQHKVTVIGDIEVEVLINKLMKIGKRAELWPEEKEKKNREEKSNATKKADKRKDGQKKESRQKGKSGKGVGGGGATTVGDHHHRGGDGGGELDLVQQQQPPQPQQQQPPQPQQQHNVWQQFPAKVFLPTPVCNVCPTAPGLYCYHTPTPLPAPEHIPKFHAQWCPYSGDFGGGRSCRVCGDENVAACRVM